MYDDKLATYFIAVPTDNGFGHMTVKFLGKLTDMEVYKWISELNKLKGMEKFPVKSLGVGVLGRYNSHIVDYVQENKRLLRTLGVFGNTPSTQPPHVTRQKIIAPMNTGPLSSMDTVLADKVVLYKVVGPKKYQVVHEVQLSKRNPLTWVMDGLGLSKYAEEKVLSDLEFHKSAFWAVAPLKVKNRKEWESGKGYTKEYINRTLGAALGALPGAAVFGAGAAKGNTPLTAIGALLALAGSTTGGVRSLHKSERSAKVKTTGLGQYLGRTLGAGVGQSLIPVPLVGGAVGDYVVSRHMQKH